ncbi:MAG: hypothetical protein KDJ65_24170 [Anaerolineae bacterium]|nr:hypothetical protein [Anaerolineae bacterium]
MRALNILLCGSDPIALQKMARKFKADGLNVRIVDPVRDGLAFSEKFWDFLLIDLDGLNSFMRSLLPAVVKEFPNLPIIGISRRSGATVERLINEVGVELDGYAFDVPGPEDLIVSFPHIAARYKADDTRPLYSRP